jgi:O-antigen/teichoic acid export membrane protein
MMRSSGCAQSESVGATRTQLYWNTLIRLPVQALRVVASIIVARILLPRDYGIMGIGMMLIGYANLFTTFGFGDAIVQKGVRDRRIINSVFAIDLCVSIVLAAGFFAASGAIAGFFDTPEAERVIQVLSSFFIITAFQATPHALLRRDMNFKAISIIDTARSLLIASITLALAIMQFGYWALVFGQLTTYALTSVALCIQARWLPAPGFSHRAMKNIYDFGLWSFLKTQVGFVSKDADKFVIGRWLGTQALGLYDKAMSLATMPLSQVTVNINAVMFSAFSKDQRHRRELRQKLYKSITVIAGINFPLFAGLAVTAPWIVNGLLGDKWAPMIQPFQIILLGCMVKSFSGLITAFNVGVGRYRAHTIRSMLSLTGFLGACFAFIPFGLRGIAAAFLAYNVLYTVLTGSLTRRCLAAGRITLFMPLVPPLAGAAIMAAIVAALGAYVFTAYTLVNCIILCLCGAISYVAYILIDRSWQMRELKTTLWKDIRKFSHAGKLARNVS